MPPTTSKDNFSLNSVQTQPYASTHHKDGTSAFSHAGAAFQESIEIFSQKLTKDPKKRQRLEQLQATNLQDVLDLVISAKQHYEQRHACSRIRQHLFSFSTRICYYGNIMDVLVQHHPEYVSLAWGAFKLLFGAVVEHERTGSTILTALCQIADSLPHVELNASLYDSSIMQQAVSMLYAHILRFLMRALDWYEEGRLAHFVHSITKPATLRYDDILAAINRDTDTIKNISDASSHVEQREIHNELIDLHSLTRTAIEINHNKQTVISTQLSQLLQLVENIRETAAADRVLGASSRIEIRETLSEIQLAQALHVVSEQCSINHKTILESFVYLRNARRASSVRGARNPFWTSPALQEWNTSRESSLILLKASFRERITIRDFCVNVIEQLSKSHTAVLWILQQRECTHTLHEVLKSLIHQALSIQYGSEDGAALQFKLRNFINARSDDEYINLLGEVLQRFELVYILVSAEAILPDIVTQSRLALRQLADTLHAKGASTVLRIIVTSHSPGTGIGTTNAIEDRILALPKDQSGRSGRKAKVSRLRQEKSFRRPFTSSQEFS